MLSPAVFVSCIFVVMVAADAYPQRLLSDSVHAETLPFTRNPGLTMEILCWDGSTLLENCEKHSTLMRQLMYKLLFSLKTDAPKRDGDSLVDEQDKPDTNIPAKKREEDNPSFYSNW